MERPRLDLEIPAVAREAKISEDSEMSYYPRVSNSGSCPRALTYTARGIKPVAHSGRMALIFDDGHLHEDASIKWLGKTPYNVDHNQLGLDIGRIPGADKTPRECSTCQAMIDGDLLHGHIDGIVHSETNTFLFEHKSMSDFAFRKIDTEFPEGYIGQCCCYLRGLKDLGVHCEAAILLCKNKNNSHYKQLFVEYDYATDSCRVINESNGLVKFYDEVVRRVIDLHAIVEECRHMDANLPERPYLQDDWQCEFCRFSEVCWAGYADEVEKYSEANTVADSDFLAELVNTFHVVRNNKNQLDNETKDLRRQILMEMQRRKLRSGKVGNLGFSLSVMKKEILDQSLIPADVAANARKTISIDILRTKEK